MRYTREKLQSLRNQSELTPEFQKAVQILVSKVLSGENLTLAEEHFVCAIIPQLRNENSETVYKIKDLPLCENYRFRHVYLLYSNDLNGYENIMNYDGEISQDQKKEDVEYLQNEYEKWESYISSKLNGSNLINYIAQETNQQLKQLNKYCEELKIGSNRKEYLKKSLLLHGKYIYLLVKEYYEEKGIDEEIIGVNGKAVLIDSYTYIHTMFRHYSAHLKQHQENKTYHFDKNIGFKTIPDFLSRAIYCYAGQEESSNFSDRSLYFKYNGTIYAIWFRPFSKFLPGGLKKEFLRVQTFYPVERESELLNLEELEELETDCGFIFLLGN